MDAELVRAKEAIDSAMAASKEFASSGVEETSEKKRRIFYQQRKLKKRSVDLDLYEFSKQNNETLKNTTGTLPDSPIINSTITETRQILFNIQSFANLWDTFWTKKLRKMS